MMAREREFLQSGDREVSKGIRVVTNQVRVRLYLVASSTSGLGDQHKLECH
jgi:hypothetical protein